MHQFHSVYHGLRCGALIEIQDSAMSRSANDSLREMMACGHRGDEPIADALAIAFLMIMITYSRRERASMADPIGMIFDKALFLDLTVKSAIPSSFNWSGKCRASHMS
jgi:hypothetical protein